MPTKITVTGTNAGVLDYKYSADGIKLQKKKTQGGVTTTTDYAGSFVYENNVLKQFNQPEGYVEPNGASYQYVYRLTDVWGNTRITYADDDASGDIDPATEIRREQNYYPFGLEHKGYNTTLVGANNNLKTYQKQEFTEDLGLNTHQWKYRVSDPAIGRFWQVDPLAEDYTYNSTYAFQENKLGSGIELEGLETKYWKVVFGALKFLNGVENVVVNETYGEAYRQIESGQTNDPQVKERLKMEGMANRSDALGEMIEGATEATAASMRIVGENLEMLGDGFTYAGILIGNPVLGAVGEVLSIPGIALNLAADALEGKFSYREATANIGTQFVFGAIGKNAEKFAKRGALNSQSDSQTKFNEAYIKGAVEAWKKVFEKTTSESIKKSIDQVVDPKNN